MTAKRIGLFLGPSLFILLQLFPVSGTMPPAAVTVVAVVAWMAVWWTTEAIPIAVTALLPIVLFPLAGGIDLDATTAAYGHRFVFLFLGGFLLALSIEKWNLHRRIALGVIALIGSDVNRIILGGMLATAGLSMWISNTATAVMMMPIGAAIVRQLSDDPATARDEHGDFGKAFMLAIAYSASIGGMATLIGTPVNLVLVGVFQEAFGVEISFLDWLLIGLPVSLLLLGICWWYLTRIAFRFPAGGFAGGRAEIARLRNELGPMTPQEKRVLIVFSVTALLWIARSYLLEPFLPEVDDSIIAMAAGIVLFLLPGNTKGEGLLSWSDTPNLPWGIILLMGGGFALAAGFQLSGLAEWIGTNASVPDALPLFAVVLIVTTLVNFLTEITSNVATTAMLLPVLAAAAVPLGIDPYLLLVPATLAATCAFMLPVATPPNAVVFGSGYLTIPDMVRAGFRLNVLSIVVITLFGYFVLPLLW